MNRSVVLAVGIGAFAALCWWCISYHAGAIEDDVFERASAALSAGDTPWAVPLFADGQRVAIGGVAPSDAARESAEATILAIAGVSSVDNQITVREGRVSVPAAEYAFGLMASDGDVVLTGQVPDDGVRASVVGAARSAFRDRRVVDRLDVAAGAPARWGDAVKAGIAAVARLDRGDLEIVGKRVSISGVARGRSERDGLAREFRDLGFDVDASVTLAPPTAEEVAACQAEFDRLLSSRIRFSTGSAAIATDSYPLLDELARAVKDCDSVSVEVQGHTDSRGAAENNLRLSERRAEAVVTYLIAEGVAADQLSALGYGEAEPLAPNDTPAGRARNRRIEFKIIEDQE